MGGAGRRPDASKHPRQWTSNRCASVAAPLGLALVIEGMPYFLFPERIPGLLRQLEAIGPGGLRALGMLAMLAGVALLLLGRWLG